MIKTKHINDNKIAEFLYKMLHNIICNNVCFSKWIKDNGDNCNKCKTITNIQNIYFFNVKMLKYFKKTRILFFIYRKWKLVILGFYLEKK